MEEKDKKKEDKSKKKSEVKILFRDPDSDFDISELDDLGPDPEEYDPDLPEWVWEKFRS
jgi:hypothetical protein